MWHQQRVRGRGHRQPEPSDCDRGRDVKRGVSRIVTKPEVLVANVGGVHDGADDPRTQTPGEEPCSGCRGTRERGEEESHQHVHDANEQCRPEPAPSFIALMFARLHQSFEGGATAMNPVTSSSRPSAPNLNTFVPLPRSRLSLDRAT